MTEHLIIIKHSILRTISDEEVIDALPDNWKNASRDIIQISPVQVRHEESGTIHWEEVARNQRHLLLSKLQELCTEGRNCRIVYFGTAPIPLTMHLGYCVGTWAKTGVFQYSRDLQNWKWVNPAEYANVVQEPLGVPKELYESSDDIILRVQTSFPILPESTTKVVEHHSREIVLSTTELDREVFKHQDQLTAFANMFDHTLDAIKKTLPNTDTVHLFAAVPPGVAFMMGTKVNPSIAPRIQTYQHTNTDGQDVYEPALVLQSQEYNPKELTTEEKQKAAELRTILNEEYKQIQEFVRQLTEGRNKMPGKTSWAPVNIPDEQAFSPLLTGRWKNMPRLEETPILDSTIDLEATDTGERFYDDDRKTWMLDDRFLLSLLERVVEPEAILIAFRLFIFHESNHFARELDSFRARAIGRYPRVLEEADYYADVWAMIHEYSYTYYSKGQKAIATIKDARFFVALIELALKTFWAFDANVDMSRPQVRRVNRYLIWYYQRCQLKHTKDQSLSNALELLSMKPILDLRWPNIKADSEGRTEYVFSRNSTARIGLGIYNNMNVVKKEESSTDVPLNDLIAGFIEKDSKKIENAILAFYKKTT